MIRLHGPWTDAKLGRANRTISNPSTDRADFKDTLLVAATSRQCGCKLCENGQRGLPDGEHGGGVMWCRDSKTEERYIVQRPGGVG